MKRMAVWGMLAAFAAGSLASAGPECCPEKAAANRKAAIEKADKALARLQAVPEQVKIGRAHV